MLTVEQGILCNFLGQHGVDTRFYVADNENQAGVLAHSYGSVQLSGVTLSRMAQGCIVYATATATLADYTVSETHGAGVAVLSGGTAKLDNSKLFRLVEKACLWLTQAVLRRPPRDGCTETKEVGASDTEGGKLIAHVCESSGNCSGHDECGYLCYKGVLELLNCTSDGDGMGCVVMDGHLTANHVAVNNSEHHGFQVLGGKADLKGCSATSSRHGCGMLFGAAGGDAEAVRDGAKACVEKYTVAKNHAKLPHQSLRGGGVLTIAEVTVDGVVESGTVHDTS